MMATNFDKVVDNAEQFQVVLPLVGTTTNLRVGDTPSQLTLEDLLSETRQYLAEQDIEQIKRAYDLAFLAHRGALRRSGEPYIQHPLEVALLLAAMRIDAEGIVAALLHDVVEDTNYSVDDLRDQFGLAVANIVDGVTKFNALTLSNKPISSDDQDNPMAPPSLVDKRRLRIETVRKMLLAMAEDPRVVVLKLADRLHNMRTLAVMSPAHQLNTARETNEIYAPLARRLGMSLVQADLEDLAFSYLEPEKYKRLARQVEEDVKRRLPFITEVQRALHAEMKRAGINAEIMAWRKHLASIHRKLEDLPSPQNSDDLSQIHDMVSFRILVDTDYECYLALGHIHALWRPKDGCIKDFIAIPKVNGYQSLHTTVFCLDNCLVDIQIRTHDMERTADYGIASYWYLKDRIMGQEEEELPDEETVPASWRLSYREMVTWIEQLREWQHSLPQEGADEFVEAVKGDIFQEQIFVFTPKGEVKDLPVGSTPLDMAYRIHTDIGDHCAGARIISNMDDSGRLVTRLVPLDYKLKGGEIVDIIVNREVHPTRDWLSFARTAAARTKIRRYLKTYEHQINIQLGRELLSLVLKASGTDGVNEMVEELLAGLSSEEVAADSIFKKYATVEDIYLALGREDLQVEPVLEHLLPLLPKRFGTEQGIQESEKDRVERSGRNLYKKDGESTILVHLAQCCCPLPGDEIVGFLTPDRGMVVHRSGCQMLRRNRGNTHTLVEINWLQIQPEYYLAPIGIIAYDRAGLLRDVAAVVADAGVNMTSVTSASNTATQKAVITATLEIPSESGVLDQIERIQGRLRQVKGVLDVGRASGK
jgi:GTP pyrophosphokinase